MSAITDTFERPLRDLRISVTDRCNFRCTYCMPAEIFHERFKFMPHEQILSFEEITRLTKLITGMGAVKLRLTGGEPLVRQDIDKLVHMLAQIEGVEDLAMTTNAYLLPKFAGKLKDAGLKRLTISLDSLDEAVFHQMNGQRASVAKVLEGIQAAKDVGFDNIKINCVVQRGVNDHTIVDMARWARDEGHIVRFIEYMDVGTMNGWKLDEVVPAKEIVEKIDAAFSLEPDELARLDEKAGSNDWYVVSVDTVPSEALPLSTVAEELDAHVRALVGRDPDFDPAALRRRALAVVEGLDDADAAGLAAMCTPGMSHAATALRGSLGEGSLPEPLDLDQVRLVDVGADGWFDLAELSCGQVGLAFLRPSGESEAPWLLWRAWRGGAA